MGQMVLRVAGAAVGAYIGSYFGATAQGAMIGYSIGGALTPAPTTKAPSQTIQDLLIPGTDYGQAIPYARGSFKTAGQMWWNTDKRATTTTQTTGGKGGGGGVQSDTVTYQMDCLIGLTDNVIIGVARVWLDGHLIYTADSGATAGSLENSQTTAEWTRMTVYTGAADQLADPTYEAAVGAGNAPAYRGRGSVFIEGLQLWESGQPRNLLFEVVVDGAHQFSAFDPANTDVRVTLSNTNHTAAGDGTTAQQMTKSLYYHTSGKLQCDFTIDQANAGMFLGIVTTDAALDSYVGQEAYSYGYNPAGAYAYHAGIEGPFLGGAVVGDVITMLLDLDLGTLKYEKNGTPLGTAYTGITGSWTPAVSFYGSGGGGAGQITANFGATDFPNPEPEHVGWGPDIDTISIVPPAVSDVVSDLCLRAGLTAGQIDVTALSSITRTVRCLPVSQITSTRQILESLMATYFFEMTVSDKIYFRPRGGSSVASIPYLDLGASTGDEPSDPLALKEANDIEMPAQIAFSYINVSADYETGTELSDRLISAVTGTVAQVNVSIGMTPAEAKAVVDTMLQDRYASRWSASIALLGDYCRLEPTDPFTVTGTDGSTYRLRIVKKTDSYPLLTFDTVLDDVSVLTSQGITSADYTSSTVVAAQVDTSIELLDIPILRDTDDDAGFYVAAKGDSTPWPGAAIFDSADNVEYARQTTVGESAVFGTCTTTLGDWTGPRVIDELNSVTVNVGSGTLASSTRAAVLSDISVNAMLVGSELIQFITATLVSPGVYTLTRLLRGGRGTEWAMVNHAASERCVLLRTAGLRRIVLNNSELGVSRYYKGVTLGRTVSSATAEAFTDNAIGLKPFSPFDLRAARDGSNNITFTWQRRTRLDVRTTGARGISVPLGEDSESYEVDIYADGTYAAVLRTISATTTTASYSAANQTADGLTPGDPIYRKAYQISAQVGRGYPLTGVS